MGLKPYSFVDIAVLDGVRERFARGDAIAVLSTELDTIIWANGPGAQLLGHPNVEGAISAPSGLGAISRRQIAAIGGFPEIGANRNVTVRLATGAAIGPVSLSASSIRLPRGEQAILLALPSSHLASRSAADVAAEALSGLVSDGQAAALVDSAGEIVAATGGLPALDIPKEVLQSLVAEVRDERDRLIKRVVATGQGRFPCAFARLTDDPAHHLLIAVTQDGAAEDTSPSGIEGEAPAGAASAEDGSQPIAQNDAATGEDLAGAKAGRAEDFAAGRASEPREKPQPGAPVRFVWRTDADGRFSAISNEFVEAVGPTAADVIGRSFHDVATVFGMDPDREITELLERRDTWSGRTVLWPIAGTDRRAPVDLAALPVYDRGRNFQGFRGFGVLRLDDAQPDPERIGLSLVPGSKTAAIPVVPAGDAAPLEDPTPYADPFRGEVPALALSPKQENLLKEKAAEMADSHAPAPERGLSAVERIAFREIGERLRKEQRSEKAEGKSEEKRVEAAAEPVTSAAPVSPRVSEEPKPTRPDRTEPPSTDTSILDKLPVPILIHSGDLLHYANPEFLRLTGYDSLAELIQQGGLGELFPEPYGDEPSNDGHRLKMRNRDGGEFPVEALMRFAPWAGKRALMLVVRQTGEPVDMAVVEEMRSRLAEMRTIVDTATDGVILIDPQGAIRSISQPAEALFGFDSDDVKDKPLISLFAIESQQAVADYMANLSQNGVASVLNDGREVIGRESEGNLIPLFMTIGQLPNGGFCAVVRDITQWKRAEEELTKARSDAEHASSQKSEFLARVSHEIRTPLNAIIGFSELMIDERFGAISNDRYRDYLRDINRSGNHVLDLVNDLLDISKIEAGQQEMSYEAVSLNDALSEAVAIMQPQANRERVIIRSSFSPKLPDIVADLRSIRQIALNILSNAVRYTQAGGQVVVSTAYEKNGDIVMRVRDTGVGMSPSEIEQAMKPFRQINALKRARGDGTGLGLPLTKAMVEANRAHFSLNSKPGEGTLVEVTFPSTRVLAQ